MRRTTPLALALLLCAATAAAKDVDEKLWEAVRKGNVEKVARLLESGTSTQGRIVALSVAVSNNEAEAFDVLWNRDRSDVAEHVLDYALCYAHRVLEPADNVRRVLNERALTVDACCEANATQPYCMRRPIRLTKELFPPARCETVFTDEDRLPPGAVRIATLWDARSAVLDPAGSARYGTPELSPAGAREWALEFAATFGALGADAILITVAGRHEGMDSNIVEGPVFGLSGFKFGKVVDRLEIVAIRTNGGD